MTDLFSPLPISLSTSGGELQMNVASHCTSVCEISYVSSLLPIPLSTSAGKFHINVVSHCTSVGWNGNDLCFFPLSHSPLNLRRWVAHECCISSYKCFWNWKWLMFLSRLAPSHSPFNFRRWVAYEYIVQVLVRLQMKCFPPPPFPFPSQL